MTYKSCLSGAFFADASPDGSGVTLKFLFSLYLASVIAFPHNVFKRLDAAARFWRLLKKFAHGSFRFRCSRKFPRLKLVGSNEGFTSDHDNGIENEACALRRTEYGVTTVCTAPFRNGSRYTRSPRSAIACSTVNSLGCSAA